VLPRVYALEQGALVRRTRNAPAEFVRAFQLLEELDGVGDAVDAELEGIHVPGVERNGGLAAAPKVRCELSEKYGRLHWLRRAPSIST